MPSWKCCGCKDRFEADTMIKLPAGRFHSMDCAISYSNAKQERARARLKLKAGKEQRKKDKATRERLKSRGDWIKEAQTEFNKFIRLKDRDEPCISCQKFHPGQYHAGHYLTTGAHPELRFTEDNCHKQCAPCNNHLSGNIIRYRENLIIKIGLAAVEELEGPHDLAKWSIDDIKAIKQAYKTKTRELQRRIDQ